MRRGIEGWRSAPLALVAAALPALSQQSASFDLGERTLNAGGNPQDGAILTSASYRISLDAIGDPVAIVGLSSSSYQIDAGLVVAYPPPGEVLDLRFTSNTTLVWTPERSVGGYGVYRGLVSSLPGGYGTCLQSNLPSAQATDTATPPPGQAYFYIVTAENRLDAEGTKGHATGGIERVNPAPCP